MKLILLAGVLAVVALSVAGAPTYKEDEVPNANQRYIEEYLRERRTPYGGGYVSPCAAASSLQVPVYASVPQYGAAHVSQYGAPHGPQYGVPHVPQYGYPGPHYRSAEQQNEELLGFSDMDVTPEHMQMARYGAGYGGASLGGLSSAGLSSYGGHGLGTLSAGPALGVFPNARVGGCNVPLLFSCSPQIVPGHMMDSQGHGALLSALPAGLPESYRIVDEPVHHEAHEQHETVEHEHINSAHESTSATHQ